jgi:acetophenone carboxylase
VTAPATRPGWSDNLDERLERFGRPLVPPAPGFDPETLTRPVLEPITPLEEAGAGLMDETDLLIFEYKLDAIVDEGRQIFISMGLAELIQSGDLGVGIFTAQGDNAAMSAGVLLHNLLHSGPIKYVLKHYADEPTVGLRDGDVYFFNDSEAGGVHSYDHFLMMPVFVDGQLLAWVGCGGHQGESGSTTPGGFTSDALSRYEEGIHVPPMRVGSDFRLWQDHLDWLTGSVRTPRTMGHDTRARLAVCLRLRDRLLREVEKRGAAWVAGGMRATIQRGMKLARGRIRGLNDGTYRAVAFLDTIGPAEGLVRLPVAIHKRGDEIVIDVSGASPEPGIGPFHLRWHLLRAASTAAIFPTVFRGLRWSAGMFDPIKVLAPPSIANSPTRDAATGSGSHTGRVVVQALSLAAARMIFASEEHRVAVAAPFAENLLLMQFGYKDQRGGPLAGGPANGNATGQGARYDMDGLHSAGFFWAMVIDCPGPEEQETKFPWLYLFRNRLDRNVHGFGRFRGGVGLADCFVPHNVSSVTCGAVGTGGRFTKNLGLFGGYAGAANPRIVIRDTNVRELLAASSAALPLSVRDLLEKRTLEGRYEFLPPQAVRETYGPDDVIVLARGSGGGYGDPLEREPDAVARDLAEDLIDAAAARDIYGVVLAEDGSPDETATEARRAEIRSTRLAQGRPWAEFMADWSRKRPPESALRYYGRYPIPESADEA